MERRPQRACTMAELPTLEGGKQEQQQGTSREQQQGASQKQQQQGPSQEQQQGPSQTAVSAALKAVQGLATSLPAEADAAYADAIVAVMPLLRAAPATASSSVAVIKDGIQVLHDVVAEGKDLEPGVLGDLLKAVRELPAAAAVGEQAAEAMTPRLEAERLVPAKRRVGEASGPSSKKRHAGSQEKRRQQQQWIQVEPCAGCGDPAGDQIICGLLPEELALAPPCPSFG